MDKVLAPLLSRFHIIIQRGGKGKPRRCNRSPEAAGGRNFGRQTVEYHVIIQSALDSRRAPMLSCAGGIPSGEGANECPGAHPKSPKSAWAWKSPATFPPSVDFFNLANFSWRGRSTSPFVFANVPRWFRLPAQEAAADE
jgi:hypothetical protein